MLPFPFVLQWGMSRPPEETLHFIVQMALRRALKLVRGLRKQITDLDERIMTTKLIRELHVSGWEIRKRPDAPSAGFTFEPPEGPQKQ